ncbi:MAG: divalent cation tolerance protein CutA [Candidatus Micrarchaeota archaeon]
MEKFCQVLISATSKKEADRISDNLVQKRLVAGSLILKGPSRYWWEGKIVEKEYFNVQAFSVFKNKDKIISEAKKGHSDECPIIAFFAMDGNADFLKWIRESVE